MLLPATCRAYGKNLCETFSWYYQSSSESHVLSGGEKHTFEERPLKKKRRGGKFHPPTTPPRTSPWGAEWCERGVRSQASPGPGTPSLGCSLASQASFPHLISRGGGPWESPREGRGPPAFPRQEGRWWRRARRGWEQRPISPPCRCSGGPQPHPALGSQLPTNSRFCLPFAQPVPRQCDFNRPQNVFSEMV